jgi:hypothetical protein
MSVPHLRTAIIAASLVGVGISGYLTYMHYAGIEPICAASHGCEKVQTLATPSWPACRSPSSG